MKNKKLNYLKVIEHCLSEENRWAILSTPYSLKITKVLLREDLENIPRKYIESLKEGGLKVIFKNGSEIRIINSSQESERLRGLNITYPDRLKALYY